MKVNHMICPACGHDFFTDAAYATCDACQMFFYAAASQTCSRDQRPKPALATWVDYGGTADNSGVQR